MSEATPSQNGDPRPPDAEVSPNENAALSEEERERIRREELRSFRERSYREEVRRELRGASLWDRMLRVLKLESGVFAEIAADPQATSQAVIAIALAYALCLLKTGPLLLISVPAALVGIAVTAGIVSFVARFFADEPPRYAPLFRVLGYASIPAALGLVPLLGDLVAAVYIIVLGVVAIREACRISTGQAVLVFVIAVVLPWIVFATALITVGVLAIGHFGLFGHG